MSDIKPTRSELIKLERKIKLAVSGHSLLKRKRDGLIREFFQVYESARLMQSELSAKYARAKQDIDLARAVDGTIVVKAAAHARTEKPNVQVESKNIMGVIVPEVQADKTRKKVSERGYGLYCTSARIDHAAESYETLVDDILVAVEIETTMRRLLLEIEKTKRRVNALEFIVIPNMQEIAAFIQLRLEELERENVFRLKKIKG